jgi:hypothetical protein
MHEKQEVTQKFGAVRRNRHEREKKALMSRKEKVGVLMT